MNVSECVIYVLIHITAVFHIVKHFLRLCFADYVSLIIVVLPWAFHS